MTITRWIVLAVIVVAVVVAWKLLRGLWTESTAQTAANASIDERRSWPAPSAVGERVMWCPILAKKVILADTRIDDGEIGSVVGFTDEKNQPIVTFDNPAIGGRVIDKWGATRVAPAALAGTRRTSTTRPPKKRSGGKKKKRRN